MLIRTWTSSLFLIGSILSLPVYSHSSNSRLIIRFKEGISSYASDAIHQSLGIKAQKKLKHLHSIQVVDLPKRISIKDAVALYKKNPDVLYVEPDFTIKLNPVKSDVSVDAPVDQFAQQWALENKGQKVGKYTGKLDADINGPESWELTKGDPQVVVGIIDTGIFYTHPALKQNIWNNPGEIPGNGIDDDGNGFVDDEHGINAADNTGDPKDDNGHGTHCSGIMGGAGSYNGGKGIFGVNQKVSIAGCKFLDSEGSGSMSDALVCFDYFVKLKTRVKNPVNLVAINASWGGGRYSQAMFDSIKALGDAGILLMAAAGNDREDNDTVDSFPANYKLPNVISVAATNNQDELAYFSNFGRRSVHVSAPGMDILSTWLNDGYEVESGTSMATPYVTGLAGLLKAKDPSLSSTQIKNLILAGGTQLGVLSSKTLTGRRIRGADKDGTGSMTCVNQRVWTRVAPIGNQISAAVGDKIQFAVMKIKCGESDRAPSMTVSMGRAVDFTDRNNDGNYTAEWTADSVGSYDIDLGDGDKVTVEVK